MLAATLALIASAGCGRIGFDVVAGRVDDGGVDAPDGSITADAAPLDNYWVTTAETRGIVGYFVTRPLTAGVLTPACAEFAADNGYRFLIGHPSRPYAYAVEQQLEGIGLGCATDTITPVLVGAGSRPLSRVVLTPGLDVGFFNADGPGSTEGLYRFTIAADATPAAGGSITGPGESGPMVFDATQDAVYAAGNTQLLFYALGANHTFAAAGVPVVAGCVGPSDILLGGNEVVVLCNDDPMAYRFSRDAAPQALGVYPIGAVDQAIALPNDRAVITRVSPPRLAILDLGAGATIVDGPMLTVRSTGLAVSNDYRLVVALEEPTPGVGRITVWQIVGDTLVPVDSVDIAADGLSAVAITPPP